MKSGPIVVLATKNKKKIEEIQEIVGDILTYKTVDAYVAVGIQEVGRTLVENSLAKATFTFRVTNLPSLADDSGLFVNALKGEPGVFSSRYGKDDHDRIRRLLAALEGKKDRTASFKAVFVYYYAPQKYKIFEGECFGTIAEAPRGTHGFGYDPVFIPRGYTKTFAELGRTVKNRISHRARALQKFKKYIVSGK